MNSSIIANHAPIDPQAATDKLRSLIRWADTSANDVIDLIAAGADPNASTSAGDTLLYVAASNGRHDLVVALLAMGADAGKRGLHGVPLHAAINARDVALQTLLYTHAPDVWTVGDIRGHLPITTAKHTGHQPTIDNITTLFRQHCRQL